MQAWMPALATRGRRTDTRYEHLLVRSDPVTRSKYFLQWFGKRETRWDGNQKKIDQKQWEIAMISSSIMRHPYLQGIRNVRTKSRREHSHVDPNEAGYKSKLWHSLPIVFRIAAPPSVHKATHILRVLWPTAHDIGMCTYYTALIPYVWFCLWPSGY